MSNNNFYCAIRIDCEATQPAYDDIQLGENSVKGFVEIIEAHDMLGTFFVIPTDLEASPDMYKGLVEKGHEVSLHLHPAAHDYEEFLGVYGHDDQYKILKEAADRFDAVMGYRPRGICIGYHSMNDYTYPILSELGFTHGDLSQPSRILPECASVWAGSIPEIHYTNAYNRILPGSLNLVDVPCTNDPESRMWSGKHPLDLRIELVDAKNHWYTMKKTVDRLLRNDTPVKHITFGTHNFFRFDKPENFRRETLIKMIENIKKIVASKNGKLVGATIEQIAQTFRKICPLEQASAPKLELDTRGRS